MTADELMAHVMNRSFGLIFASGPLEFHLSQHLIMLWVSVTVATLLAVAAARSRLAGGGRMATAAEYFIVTVRDGVVIPALGEHYGRKYLPFFLALALLILVSNLLGLVPNIHAGPIVIGGAATGNLWINIGLASFTFLFALVIAIREHGPLGYLKSFVPHGIPLFIAPLIWVLEFGGILIKHMVLSIRLTANMIAGHLVIFAILGMVVTIVRSVSNPSLAIAISIGPILLATAIFLLEILVAFIQTTVFTILAAVFVGMAVNPRH
jgi:F-type H+-transporting ATPase subunit a